MTADIWFYLFPLYILGGLLLILGTFALLGRIQNGRYLKPIINFMMKLPLVGRLMKKASQAALERQNPELASAVKKLERSGVARDPMRAQQALSRLSASERAGLHGRDRRPDREHRAEPPDAPPARACPQAGQAALEPVS